MAEIDVEILYWEGCPSHPKALELVRRIAEEQQAEADVSLIEVRTEEEAQERRFPGSPTVRIAGRDVDPAGAGPPFRLTCRLYQSDEGRPSPIPSASAIRAGFQEALDSHGKGGS